jgi:hypothetical protein
MRAHSRSVHVLLGTTGIDKAATIGRISRSDDLVTGIEADMTRSYELEPDDIRVHRLGRRHWQASVDAAVRWRALSARGRTGQRSAGAADKRVC